jgi:Alg9-like mannosyltransferase family
VARHLPRVCRVFSNLAVASNVNMYPSARLTPGRSRAPPLRIKRRPTPPGSHQPLLQDKRLLLFLIGFRIFNALTITTFFQPDEYYQSLEPAWRAVFGYGELTWEWREGIRGFLYPSLFASLWWILKTVGIQNPHILVRIGH